ncbi:MAG: ABC transporter ATP-binding protein, partial [Treponema sp.]|nr:ABC transporter ATP-binding protein [Treponema sp.]
MAYISLQNISKTFGEVHANTNVSLDIEKGEILALLGENGSGKTTLVNMLAGLYSPDAGSIYIDGKLQKFSNPADSIKAGIGMVHQHFLLVNVMTALENITMGEKSGFFINKKQIRAKILKLIDTYGLSIDPDKKIYEMSVSEKQTVEILKVLYRGARILILDEPTAVLTPQETDHLFEVLKKMKSDGCTIIIITHKLHEVMSISDRVAVLRKGEYAGILKTKDCNPSELTNLMVGHQVSLEIERPDSKKSTEPLLQMQGVTFTDKENHSFILNDIKFDLFGGEILGVAGIAGSGQKELCESIAGLVRPDSGSIKFMKEELVGLSPLVIKKKGIRMSFVPEDRLGMGLVAGMNIIDNVMLKTYDESKGIFMDREEGKRRAEAIVGEYDISTPSVKHVVKKLSGGNIQKVLLGREIGMNPKVLVTAYPVRGLDIGASYTVYNMLNRQKEKGVGVLFIGEDLDVLMGLSDRLMVIHDGKIMGIVDPKKSTKEEIGLMMIGETAKPVKEKK